MNETDTLSPHRKRNEKLCPAILLLLSCSCAYCIHARHTLSTEFLSFFLSFYFPEDFVGTAAASEPWKLLLRWRREKWKDVWN